MTETKPVEVVKWPSDGEVHEAVDRYGASVGRVVLAWNHLQEKLGELFVFVMGTEAALGLSVWYSSDSDRVQRMMLRAAILASKDDRWLPRLPTAKDDLLWVVDRANALADERNNVIHTPAMLMTDATGTEMRSSMTANLHGHPRARRLWGKKLTWEFERCERGADALARFIGEANVALNDDEWTWPDRPSLPSRVPHR